MVASTIVSVAMKIVMSQVERVVHPMASGNLRR